jgi:phosphoglycolate phosphatase-like HAD superfamily hydrolase
MRHIVWDWNGTLFDDLPIVIAAFNASLEPFGLGPVDSNGYRDLYTRPVSLMYSRLLGRDVPDDEMASINDSFFDAYRASLDAGALMGDAPAALETVAGAGVTQSVLSLFWHDDLQRLADRLGVARYMTHVQGNQGVAGEAKAQLLDEHLAALLADIPGLDRSGVVAIGDSLDDAKAAAKVGIGAVLYDGGSHHRSEMEATGVPVTGSLVEAVAAAGLG